MTGERSVDEALSRIDEAIDGYVTWHGGEDSATVRFGDPDDDYKMSTGDVLGATRPSGVSDRYERGGLVLDYPQDWMNFSIDLQPPADTTFIEIVDSSTNVVSLIFESVGRWSAGRRGTEVIGGNALHQMRAWLTEFYAANRGTGREPKYQIEIDDHARVTLTTTGLPPTPLSDPSEISYPLCANCYGSVNDVELSRETEVDPGSGFMDPFSLRYRISPSLVMKFRPCGCRLVCHEQ